MLKDLKDPLKTMSQICHCFGILLVFNGLNDDAEGFFAILHDFPAVSKDLFKDSLPSVWRTSGGSLGSFLLGFVTNCFVGGVKKELARSLSCISYDKTYVGHMWYHDHFRLHVDPT